MATKKERHVCFQCRRKLIKEKLVVLSWEHPSNGKPRYCCLIECKKVSSELPSALDASKDTFLDGRI